MRGRVPACARDESEPATAGGTRDEWRDLGLRLTGGRVVAGAREPRLEDVTIALPGWFGTPENPADPYGLEPLRAAMPGGEALWFLG